MDMYDIIHTCVLNVEDVCIVPMVALCIMNMYCDHNTHSPLIGEWFIFNIPLFVDGLWLVCGSPYLLYAVPMQILRKYVSLFFLFLHTI